MDLVLRKRISVKIYKKQSWKDSLLRRLAKVNKWNKRYRKANSLIISVSFSERVKVTECIATLPLSLLYFKGISRNLPSISPPFYGYFKPPSLYQSSVLRVFQVTLPLSVLCFTGIPSHPPSISTPFYGYFKEPSLSQYSV